MTFAADPIGEATPHVDPHLPAPTPITPFGRLVGATVASYFGAWVALLVPANLLLTLHIVAITGVGNPATAAFSLVAGLAGVAALIANPLAGRISDRTATRFGKRRTWILTGGLSVAIVLVALAFTTEIWQVAVAWCLVNALLQLQFAASAAALADQLVPTRRGSVSGIAALVAALGPVIGLVVISLFASTPIVQWVIIAVVSVVGAVVAVILLRDPAHNPAAAKRFTFGDLARSFWVNPRHYPAFGWAWITRLLISVMFAGLGYNALLLFNKFGMSSAEVNTNVATLTVVAIVFAILTIAISGWLSDKFKAQKAFIIVGAAIQVVGLVVLAFAGTLSIVFVAVAITGFGYGMALATDFALCVRVLPNAETFGKDFAVLNIAGQLPGILVPFIAPLLISIGGFTALYIFLAVLGVLGAIAMFRIPEIGKEGDPRWALIVRPDLVKLTTGGPTE